ncbi:MAG TPA: DKNYY domain-containing protein [Chthoniobacter sp.]|nr:DKNYY domain-containing protein [Chthoniobacter sp.]
MLIRATLLFLTALFTLGCEGEGVYRRTSHGWIWVTWNEGNGRQETSIPKAHSATFHPLDRAQYYAADSEHVYRCGEIIPGANPESFVHVKDAWWKDRHAVYWQQFRIDGADPATFMPLQHYGWAKDKHQGYQGDHPIPVHDPASFVSINEDWARDSKAYYVDNFTSEVKGADYATFQILKGRYAKDRNHIYYGNRPIKGADYETFRPVNAFWAKDRFRSYIGEEVRKN